MIGIERSLISVVIAVRNGERTLAKCLESVASQIYRPVEIVIVNDGSSDATGKICAEFAARQGNVIVITTEGVGPSQARNLAIAKARGIYVAFTDGDCICLPNWLTKLAECIISGPNVAGAGGDQQSPDDDSVYGKFINSFMKTIGFIAGYRGGIVDEILNMFTNIVLVIPSLVVLLIIAAYLEVRGYLFESIFIGFFAWPWAARAIRAQTFSLRSREFVDLARLSGMKPLKIIIKEIAPNMMSYLLLVFILQFGGAILTAATLDFIGLGPTNGVSLGLMMNNAVIYGALILGMWWWFIPPGLAITAIVGALYVTNVGLDEVFNPKLRET